MLYCTRGAVGWNSSRSLTRIGGPRHFSHCMCRCWPILREQRRKMLLLEPAVACTPCRLPQHSQRMHSQARLQPRQRGPSNSRGRGTLSKLNGQGVGAWTAAHQFTPHLCLDKGKNTMLSENCWYSRRPTLLMHPGRQQRAANPSKSSPLGATCRCRRRE